MFVLVAMVGACNYFCCWLLWFLLVSMISSGCNVWYWLLWSVQRWINARSCDPGSCKVCVFWCTFYIYIENAKKGLCKGNLAQFVRVNDLNYFMSGLVMVSLS